MKVDFVATDRPLVESAAKMIRKALDRAASASRSVGQPDTVYVKDISALDEFEKRYKGKQADEGKPDVAVRIEVPEPECVVMRTGIVLLVERHQRTESTLQKELALTDNGLVKRLGDLRELGLRFGGQASLFDPKTAAEKESMAAEMGMSGASVGAPPNPRKKKGPAKGRPSTSNGRTKRKK